MFSLPYEYFFMKKVYLETFGCQMNVSDSERIKTHLQYGGYELTADEAAADVVLFNTCSVREKAEHKLFTRVGEIRRLTEKKPLIGVLGCVAQLEGETLFSRAEINFVLGTKAVGRINQAIENVAEGQKRFIDLKDRETDYDWSVAENQRHSPFVGFVPIIEGCNKFCTYCIVPFSRGREKSLPASQIVRQILELRRQNVKEIHLIGQNVNSYRPKTESGLENFPGATPFSRLLRAVAASGVERIKFTTSFPRDFHPDIVKAVNENENLCNWAHLPVQSGSDKILRAMRRGHTVEDYKKRIDIIKSSPRQIALTTDIIIGFPGETDRDFNETLELFEYCAFDGAYIFKYSPRPGTPAFAMPDDVSPQTKTERFLELEKLQRKFQQKSLRAMQNKTYKVLAEKPSEKTANHLSGHTTCHRVVNFEGMRENLGEILNIKITECKTNTLFGKIL
jgi:tRNA-2-methylthio-N6-dimethylallyladenosine synthase